MAFRVVYFIVGERKSSGHATTVRNIIESSIFFSSYIPSYNFVIFIKSLLFRPERRRNITARAYKYNTQYTWISKWDMSVDLRINRALLIVVL